MAAINSAAPALNLLGTNDKSIKQVTPEAEVRPTHLPKIYGYAADGPTTPQMVVGTSASTMYGTDTFDLRKKYATHQTVLANEMSKQGNTFMFERVKPTDAGPNASVRVMIDVLRTALPVYKRNTDGSIVTGNDGSPVQQGSDTVSGFQIKFVAVPIPVDQDGALEFGLGHQVPGDQTDGTTQSIRYPLFDAVVPHFGDGGNNNGLRMWAPTTLSSNPLDTTLVTSEKVYPIRIACVKRKSANVTPSIVGNNDGEQYVDVCFKPGVIHPTLDKRMYIGDTFIKSYQNLNTPGFTPVWGPFGQFKLYDSTLAELLPEFYAAEFAVADAFSDFTGAPDEEFLFNLLGGVTTNGVPYTSYRVVTGTANSIRFTENATIYASGGSDGTMNRDLFAALVSESVKEYANPNSVLQDIVTYPESIVYDTGFPLTTKYDLCNIIAIRKNTAVALCVHIDGERPLTASQESSRAQALRTRIEQFPDSDYFGTPVYRGIIVGRSGTLLGSQWDREAPLIYSLASKAAEYMGAGNRVWKSEKNFDMEPGSTITDFTDINVTYTPPTTRQKDWDAGLIWCEKTTRQTAYFPALQTVYSNDTSVLNSFFTMMGCVELVNIVNRVRMKYSGQSHLTPQQLSSKIDQDITDEVQGKFDNRFIIIPETYFTVADKQRGYSYTTKIKLGAENMTTVMTFALEAWRAGDLQS